MPRRISFGAICLENEDQLFRYRVFLGVSLLHYILQ